MSRMSSLFSCVVFVTLHVADADPFLQKVDLSVSLRSELELALGPNCFQGRLPKLETRLQPMFVALPKTSPGLLSHSAARYALHRVSTDRHGWTIRGLEPNLDNFNTSSLVTSGILRDLLPAHIESIFEKHIGQEGFSLQNLAILAGTIDHLIREDQKTVLRKACELLDLSTVDAMGEEDLRTIIQLYMAMFLRPTLTPSLKVLKGMRNGGYPGWTETTLLLDDEREAFAYNEKEKANPFRARENNLQVALRVVEQVADHFPHHQSRPECQEIKEDLLTYERGDTGRLRLVDFYRASLASRFFFVETADYLRAVGALDESDLSDPKVIVPNYVLAKSNCLAHANYYSVCCFNECEGLYGHVEQIVASPVAEPKQIIELVANMSSSTVQAPRNLSQTLLRRLDEIASGSNGKVWLHSRLFAQWMHQAFPRECPYPHLVGTTTSLNPREWARQNGKNFTVKGNLTSHIDMLELAQAREGVEVERDDSDLMWTSDEEYFVEPARPFLARAGEVIRQSMVLVALCSSLMLAVWARIMRISGGPKCTESQQYFV